MGWAVGKKGNTSFNGKIDLSFCFIFLFTVIV